MVLRTSIARRATLAVAELSRRLHLGGGSMIGGRVGLRIDPHLLAVLSRSHRIALVSGTNGKTTTTRLLSEALGGLDVVATSSAGANMTAGLVSALCEAPDKPFAALEVDENYLAQMIKTTNPEVVVLLNLSRDQLDRVSEVRRIANRWREALSGSTTTVIANADDPLVVWAAGLAASVMWVSVGGLWREDAFHCPNCDARITFGQRTSDEDNGTWSCVCDLARPEPDATLRGNRLEFATGESFPIDLQLPGQFNTANSALAIVATTAFGTPVGVGIARMEAVSSVAGRFAYETVAGHQVRLFLAKNPAGWSELIELVRHEAHPIVIAINARDADGNDPSWLWDVPFELLRDRSVIATGDRRRDLGVRLRHAGVTHQVTKNQFDAVSLCASERIDYIGNYTAFQDFRHNMANAKSLHPEAPPIMHAEDVITTPAALIAHRDEPAEHSPTASRHRRAADLCVVVVHPDLLGTYGDGGNARVIANRALWRDLRVEVILSPSDQPLPGSGDLYLIGGGEDGPQVHSAQVLNKSPLRQSVETGAVVFAVCAGYQVIGVGFAGSDGQVHEGVGLLDVTTVRGPGPRAVGEIAGRAHGERFGRAFPLLNGFENHAGHSVRGPGVAPFIDVVRGTGNGVDHTDGAFVNNVIGTYLHGPAFARNPALADFVLGLVTKTALASLDEPEEQLLHAERVRSITGRLRAR